MLLECFQRLSSSLLEDLLVTLRQLPSINQSEHARLLLSSVLFFKGPSVLEVFHALLRHLRVSIEAEGSMTHLVKEEENFQEAIINTIGQFSLRHR